MRDDAAAQAVSGMIAPSVSSVPHGSLGRLQRELGMKASKSQPTTWTPPRSRSAASLLTVSELRPMRRHPKNGHSRPPMTAAPSLSQCDGGRSPVGHASLSSGPQTRKGLRMMDAPSPFGARLLTAEHLGSGFRTGELPTAPPQPDFPEECEMRIVVQPTPCAP